MELSLPKIAAPPAQARYGRAAADRGAVLIVDDQALIRMNAVQIVEDAGFAALQAASADQAVAILNRRRDIAAVFTDIHMSGSRSGVQLAHAVRHRWPPVILIVTSAFAEDGELPLGAHFVRKPYGNERIIALLNELIGGADCSDRRADT
jgi:CheY-like chemotaxis protein